MPSGFRPLSTHDDLGSPFLEVDHNRIQRRSRNSTGAKEAEFQVGPRVLTVHYDENDRIVLTTDDKKEENSEATQIKSKNDERMLIIVFVLMVFIGLGNKIFNKLMTIPMYNYPNFLNLLTTFVYIPVCFAYIIPMARKGLIPRDQLQMPRRPFAVMGGLDALAGIMQIFSATYLSGPLVILLVQAAIPVSMVISRYLLKATYNIFQFMGAVIVAGGILVVLAPSLSGGSSPLWACVMILSTIPMTLSSVYKEIALGETELDPIYLNGWIAVFQLLFSLILCVPSSLASEPPVLIPDLPNNLYGGLLCFFGTNSITCGESDDLCVPDNCFPTAPLFVSIYLFFNQLYNLLIILIIKYGSSNLLYLALTLMVPLGNVAFTLPFVPGSKALRETDIIGLVVICFGLGCYRFAAGLYARYFSHVEETEVEDHKNMSYLEGRNDSLVHDLLDRKNSSDDDHQGGKTGII